MPRIRGVRIKKDYGGGVSINFSYSINVDQEGQFSTTLPEDVAKAMLKDGIDLRRNRLNNAGFFIDDTVDGLKTQVDDIVDLWKSKKMISERIVLKYCIDTCAGLVMDHDGEIYPNAYWCENRDNVRRIEGTRAINATHLNAYGIQLYVQPFTERVYEFASGEVMTDFERYSREGKRFSKGTTALDFLADVNCMALPSGASWQSGKGEAQVIEYTEAVGLWFVDLIKGLAVIAKQVSERIHPSDILAMAKTGRNLLTAGE